MRVEEKLLDIAGGFKYEWNRTETETEKKSIDVFEDDYTHTHTPLVS